MSDKYLWGIEDVKGSAIKNKFSYSDRNISFSSMKLHCDILRGIKAANFIIPNKVQMEVLPCVCEGERNIFIQAPNSSGKTSTAILIVLNKLLKKKATKYPRAIMLYPTYELAVNCYTTAQCFGKFCKDIKLRLVMKGKNVKKGEKVSEDVLITTLEKIDSVSFDPANVEILVVDEIDVIASTKGYFSHISRLCCMLSQRCGIILCSSSKNTNLNAFMEEHMKQSTDFKVVVEKGKNLNIEELYLVYDNIQEKVDSLVYLESLSLYEGQTVVFCETKANITKIEAMLRDRKLRVSVLTGGKDGLKFSERAHVLEQFKRRHVKVLITTRLFATVIPRDGIDKIINFDQVLDDSYHLVLDVYEQRKCLLDSRLKGLIVNFVEAKWGDFVLSNKEVKNGKEFYNKLPVLRFDELISHFECR